MFINFEILINNRITEKVELVVSTPKEAASLIFLFENTEKVVAWECTSHEPKNFCFAPGVNTNWKKYKEYIALYNKPN